MPEPLQSIPSSSITNLDELLNMTEAELRAALDAALATMTFEEQAEYLRLLGEPDA